MIGAQLGLSAIVLAVRPKAAAEGTPWSKWSIGRDFKTPVSAAVGMLVKYLPAFCLAAGWAASSSDALGWMPLLMVAHFGKRIFEVCCVHDFTGSPTEELSESSFIALFYSMIAWLFMRAGVQAEPSVAAAGLALFALGQAGNGYHHLLLARLRRNKGSTGKYVVPAGGLFELVACPHYLFEIMSWGGAALASGTALPSLAALWVAGMLGGRAAVTTEWYRARFGDEYPASRKHLVPFVY